MSDDDHIVTRIEFRMIVDGKPVVAVFSRPQKIAELLTEPQSVVSGCARCATLPRFQRSNSKEKR